ncbi:MAG: permease [Candidatus Helarchaeota archaeon]
MEYWSHAWICILIGFIIAGLFTEFISKERISSWLKGGSWYGYIFSAIAGAILGVCSCAILPLFASLKRRGAGLGPAITFLVSGPSINPIGFLLTMNQLGLGMGISRIIGAFIMAIIIGIIMDLIFKEKSETAISSSPDTQTDESSPDKAKKMIVKRGVRPSSIPLKTRFRRSLQYSWDYTKELLWIIIIGVFIAGLVNGLVPQSWITETMGTSGWIGYPIAGFIGIPTFIVPPNEIAIGSALTSLGASPGIILTLLLAGPTVSIATIYVVRQVISDKQTLVYVVGVFLTAIALGILLSPLVELLLVVTSIEIPTWLGNLYHDAVIYGLLTITIIGAWYFHKKSQKKVKGG